MPTSAALSDAVFHILLALSDEPLHGYAILAEIEDRTRGGVTLGTGTLYTALKRLRNDGYIMELPQKEAQARGRPRRTYALTYQGRSAIAEQAERLRMLVEHAEAKDVLRIGRRG